MADTLPSPPATPPVTAPNHEQQQQQEETPPLLSPPPPPPSSSTPTDLVAELDTLLASYLALLDSYTTLRASLARDFSSGFFSLARANSTSTLGPGRRYGEEGFDGRMKAVRRVTISAESEAEAQTSPPPSGDAGTPTSSSTVPGYSISKVAATEDAPAPRDPLTWYGILTPPALRQTQAHFVGALEGSVPALLGVVAQMRVLESRIWRLRRTLGLRGYEYPREESGEEVTGEQGEGEQGRSSEPATVLSERKKKSLPDQASATATGAVDAERANASRSKHSLPEPRSRILKLG